MVSVTSMPPVRVVPRMRIVPVVRRLVLVAGAWVLEVCVGLTLVDGGVTGFPRAVLRSALLAITVVLVLGLGTGAGAFGRRGTVGRVCCWVGVVAGVVVHRVTS